MKIESIFVRKITEGDFWNIERPDGTGPTGGGGQTYIDVPMGNITMDTLKSFLNIPLDDSEDRPTKSIEIYTIGRSFETSSEDDLVDVEATADDLEEEPVEFNTIEFASRSETRYKISNQNRNKLENQRPYAWSSANGFPELPGGITDKHHIPVGMVDDLRIYIVKTFEGKYFAGFINTSTIPDLWPSLPGLQKIFDVSSADIIKFSELCDNPLAIEIFHEWEHKPNVLLYGPPGTGKTHTMNQLWKAFNDAEPIECLTLNVEDRDNPFVLTEVSLPFEKPLITKWVTFHQNYSYENYILSIKPVPNAAAFHLEAHAGTLLDAAISIDPTVQNEFGDIGNNKTAIIFIDELNRGNVSRIFGEFITFMDFEYRVGENPTPIPVPLNNLSNATPIRTETIKMSNGTEITLPIPWFFPKSVYILASMNSVDRAVAPLDSALSRRLRKINIFPDMEALATHLDISSPHKLLEGGLIEEDVTAEEVAWLLLYRINYELASLMGRDFELGQSYLYGIKNETDKYLALAKIWDNMIFPQLQERFSNRADELLRILRLDSMSNVRPDNKYLYKQKEKPLSYPHRSESPSTLNSISLSKEYSRNSLEVIYTLRFLAGLSN